MKSASRRSPSCGGRVSPPAKSPANSAASREAPSSARYIGWASPAATRPAARMRWSAGRQAEPAPAPVAPARQHRAPRAPPTGSAARAVRGDRHRHHPHADVAWLPLADRRARPGGLRLLRAPAQRRRLLLRGARADGGPPPRDVDEAEGNRPHGRPLRRQRPGRPPGPPKSRSARSPEQPNACVESPAMTAPSLEKLQVLVTGVDAAIARDVARLVAGEGASVLAADRDPATLAAARARSRPLPHPDRDRGGRPGQPGRGAALGGAAGRLRTPAARDDLLLRLAGAAAAVEPRDDGQAPRPAASRAGQPDDVTLTEARRQRCPAAIAERVLQPTLFLHAEPSRRSAFDRALAVLRHPTLRGLLERAPGRSVFSPERAVPYVRIASQLYSLRRQTRRRARRPGGSASSHPPMRRHAGRMPPDPPGRTS